LSTLWKGETLQNFEKMRQITSITRQKKRERFNIFLDKEYAFSLSNGVLIDSNLESGQRLSTKEIKDIQKREEENFAFKKALNYLAIRSRSKKELIAKLRRKKISQDIIDLAIKKVDKLGYVDDQDFARSFLEAKKSQAKGRNFIFRELKRKGVEEKIIKEVLAKFYSDEEEFKAALFLAKKKIPNFPRLKLAPTPKDRGFDRSVGGREIIKLKNYLFSRGFTWETVEKVIVLIQKV